MLLQIAALILTAAMGLTLRLLLRVVGHFQLPLKTPGVILLDTLFSFAAVMGIGVIMLAFNDGLFIPFTAMFFFLGVSLPSLFLSRREQKKRNKGNKKEPPEAEA